MRRIEPANKNEIDRLTVLKVHKIMNAIPIKWWYSLYSIPKYKITHRQILNLIAGLITQKFIVKESIFADTYIVKPTTKGHERVFNEFITPSKERTPGNVYVTFGPDEYHQYMVFRLLVDYFLTINEAQKIVSYKNQSRIEHTKFGERTVYITPDLVIYEEGNIARMYEADAGHEGSEQIFQKLLKYFYLAINNKYESEMKNINIYFYFRKASRAMNLFHVSDKKLDEADPDSGLVIRKFAQFSNNLRISHSYNISIETDQIIDVLKTGKVKFFVGTEQDKWGKFIEINFLNLFKLIHNWNIDA